MRKHEWESRKDGTKIAILSTIILFILTYFPKEWFDVDGLWIYPIPIWIAIIVLVWIIGRIIKFIFRFL